MAHKPLVAFLLLLTGGVAQANTDLQQFLQKTLEEARTTANLPAVAGIVAIDGKIEAEAAVGVRALRLPPEVTLDDRWHLGSDTKAMTATMIAKLVEGGVLSFDDTVAMVFPGIAPYMNLGTRDITLAQLLSHTSGLTPLVGPNELPLFHAVIKNESGMRAQRAAVAAYYLRQKPASARGEFSYSNLGYVIAAAMAEERTGMSWEDLIERYVWKPLGIENAGFGPPGKSGRYDQPLGHTLVRNRLVGVDPSRDVADNPPALAPAGTVNMSLRDWLKFAQDQLDGEHGRGKLLKQETYKRLHTPVTKNYAMGWGVILDKEGAPSLLTHAGSNGYWVAEVRILPKRNAITLVTTNSGGDAAEKATRLAGKALQDRIK